jgi:DNA invertase Pin-like site-specific DNA recombinase
LKHLHLLKAQGITLLPVDAPEYCTDDTPTAVMVRQILGAVSQFEKTSLVQKLRQARERKRWVVGRCEGRSPVPADAKALAKRLYRKKAPRPANVPRCGPSRKPSRNTAFTGRQAVLMAQKVSSAW